MLPSLRARIDDDPGELRHLVGPLALAIGGPRYGARLTEEVLAFIQAKLPEHDWPGNVRELLACVNSVNTHHGYTTRDALQTGQLAAKVTRGKPSREELQRIQAQAALETTGGNRKEAARLLDIDYRTLRRLLDPPGTPPRTTKPPR